MPIVKVYNMQGTQTDEMALEDSIFGVKPNKALVHQAVKMYLANQRLGTHKTKKRDEVRGGGKKPWRQKGTGRARAGSIRSPLWVGGGTVFGPQPRSYTFTMPRKARRLALKSAFSSKIQSSEIIVIDEIKLASIKTKQIIEFLKNFEKPKKALIITAEQNEKILRSSSNIPGVKSIISIGINVFDLLHHDKIFVEKAAISKIQEVFI